MAKGQSPLLGFNTNVRHKGRVFHIQTEDSGVQHPHIITHLFADGGRILKSIKTPYGDLLEAEDWVPQVKKIMQDQHKAMFIALRDGQYDALIDGGNVRTTSSQTGQHPAAPAVSQTGQHAAAASPAATNPSGAQPTPAASPAAAQPAAAQSVRRPSSPAIQVGAVSGSLSAQRPASQTPNPAFQQPASPSSGAMPAANPPSNRTGRYAPVRSPEVLGSFKPKPESTPAGAGSIFGDGMMSEKSLDEVILAYLADDLDEKKR